MENEKIDVEIDKIAKKGMNIRGITNFKSCKNYIGSFKDQTINIYKVIKSIIKTIKNLNIIIFEYIIKMVIFK